MTKDTLPDTTSPVAALEQTMDRLPALDTEEVVARTLERILNANDAAQIFANPEAFGLRDLAGRVVVLEAVAGCLPSKQRGPLSRYIVLDLTDPDTGERFAATTGSVYVVTAALRAAALGLLPQRVRVVELESASNPGQTSLWLVKA